jgi:hypothetical protein
MRKLSIEEETVSLAQPMPRKPASRAPQGGGGPYLTLAARPLLTASLYVRLIVSELPDLLLCLL